MSYIVMCEKQGGVTGYGRTELKRDGQIRSFPTREEADQVAKDLCKKMNHAWATASYRYWAEER